jgi:hypothetical protein
MPSEEQSWIEAGERRANEREPSSATAAFGSKCTRVTVDVTNISLTGVKIRVLVPLEVGALVWMRLPNLDPVYAKVIWAEDNEAGCEFLQPLHPAIFSVVAYTCTGKETRPGTSSQIDPRPPYLTAPCQADETTGRRRFATVGGRLRTEQDSRS